MWLRVTRRREHTHVVALTGIVLGTLGRVDDPTVWADGAVVTINVERSGEKNTIQQ